MLTVDALELSMLTSSMPVTSTKAWAPLDEAGATGLLCGLATRLRTTAAWPTSKRAQAEGAPTSGVAPCRRDRVTRTLPRSRRRTAAWTAR